MIPLFKLERLPPGQRRRKLALLLGGVERTLHDPAATMEGGGGFDPEYLLGLVRMAISDEKIPRESGSDIERLLLERQDIPNFLRLCNHTRHALLAAIGSFPAEWDLVVAKDGRVQAPSTRSDEPTAGDDPESDSISLPRRFFPGVCVYAEDIRSPFNLGSIFRTAEAFGAERIMISPLCVSPTHPRAQRSAMGCVDYLPWERKSLEEIPTDLAVFALETGGTPIGEFEFPDRGMVMVGSEELGISPEGLSRARYGRVSIPMTGIKASINVGVAFGILMRAWTDYLACSSSNPF